MCQVTQLGVGERQTLGIAGEEEGEVWRGEGTGEGGRGRAAEGTLSSWES